jgi:hypothetical protein
MAGLSLEFMPWSAFRARKDNTAIRSWLQQVAKASEAAFKGGMGNYPPASDPGAWPNIRTGNLKGSIRTEVTSDSMTIGSNMRYSIFLRTGTSIMARRKMSDNALQAGIKAAQLGHWVGWSRM